MKRLLLTIGILSLLLAPCTLVAKEKSAGNMKHQGPAPSDSAYEHASDNAKFKRAEGGESGKHRDKGDDAMHESDGAGHEQMEQDRHREESAKQKHEADDSDAGSDGNGKEKKMKKSDDDDKQSVDHMERHKKGDTEKSRERDSEQESDQVQY